jgi:hypothetical protein
MKPPARKALPKGTPQLKLRPPARLQEPRHKACLRNKGELLHLPKVRRHKVPPLGLLRCLLKWPPSSTRW